MHPGRMRKPTEPLVAPHDHVEPATPQQRVRKVLMFLTVCATIAAFVAVAAGYGAKPSRVERAELALAKSETGSSEAALAYRQLKAALHKQQEQMKLLNKAELAKTHKLAVQEAHHLSKLDEEEAEDADDSADDAATDDAASDDAADDDAPVEDDEAATESKVPDPEEAKKKAAEVADKAKDALAKSQADLMKAVDDLLPGGDLFHAFSWHLDICVYILTMYGVYYVWKTELWTYFLPRMKFNMVQEPELTPRTLARKNRECMIGEWSDQHLDEDEATCACDHDLLWFRKAKGEVAHFIDSKRVLPGLIDTLMCGCGGNVYAVAVTNKRIIVQNDKRCLFGTTVLTTNEDSIFVENIHKASLYTDGSLNLGLCTLHSFDMLRGGFNWIFFGLIIDIILEWKPTWIVMLGDARLEGWINMVPDDVIFMVASFFVLTGCFLFVALLWFLLMPQSVLEVEIVKQAGMETYTRTFEMPVGKAYKMYDSIMRGIVEADK